MRTGDVGEGADLGGGAVLRDGVRADGEAVRVAADDGVVVRDAGVVRRVLGADHDVVRLEGEVSLIEHVGCGFWKEGKNRRATHAAVSLHEYLVDGEPLWEDLDGDQRSTWGVEGGQLASRASDGARESRVSKMESLRGKATDRAERSYLISPAASKKNIRSFAEVLPATYDQCNWISSGNSQLAEVGLTSTRRSASARGLLSTSRCTGRDSAVVRDVQGGERAHARVVAT